jgi:hypothetical protein
MHGLVLLLFERSTLSKFASVRNVDFLFLMQHHATRFDASSAQSEPFDASAQHRFKCPRSNKRKGKTQRSANLRLALTP